jgi:hypothetical protein
MKGGQSRNLNITQCSTWNIELNLRAPEEATSNFDPDCLPVKGKHSLTELRKVNADLRLLGARSLRQVRSLHRDLRHEMAGRNPFGGRPSPGGSKVTPVDTIELNACVPRGTHAFTPWSAAQKPIPGLRRRRFALLVAEQRRRIGIEDQGLF